MKFSVLALGEWKPDFVSWRVQQELGVDYSHIAICVNDNWMYHETARPFHMAPVHGILVNHAVVHDFDFELEYGDARYALGWLQGALGKKSPEIQSLSPLFPLMRRLVTNEFSKLAVPKIAGQFLFECLKIKDARLFSSDFLTPKDIVEILNAAQ